MPTTVPASERGKALRWCGPDGQWTYPSFQFGPNRLNAAVADFVSALSASFNSRGFPPPLLVAAAWLVTEQPGGEGGFPIDQLRDRSVSKRLAERTGEWASELATALLDDLERD